jgi:LemA protein
MSIFLILIVPLLFIILLIFFIISTYNKLISLKVLVENAWSDIDAHFKRRADLVPNLVEAENILTQALRQLFALAEAYPQLRANENFLSLQKQLYNIEEDILKARRYYNAVVRDYNTSLYIFPNVIIAQLLGFKPKPFFEADEGDREVPKVKF